MAIEEIFAVNPRRRRKNPVEEELAELLLNPRRKRKRTRKNPDVEELLVLNPELEELLLNPELTPSEKRRLRSVIRALLRAGHTPREITSYIRKLLRAKGIKKTKRKKTKARKRVITMEKRRKTTRRKTKRKTTRRRGLGTKTIRLTIPRQTAKFRIALNPTLSWMQIKHSATEGFYGLLGYVISNAISNFFMARLSESGRSLSLGPLSTPTVVAGIIAIGLPFLPFQFARKTSVLTGAWINFLARVAKDILPLDWKLRNYLPAGSLGEIAQLPEPYYDESVEQYYLPSEEEGETGAYYYTEGETGEYYTEGETEAYYYPEEE